MEESSAVAVEGSPPPTCTASGEGPRTQENPAVPPVGDKVEQQRQEPSDGQVSPTMEESSAGADSAPIPSDTAAATGEVHVEDPVASDEKEQQHQEPTIKRHDDEEAAAPEASVKGEEPQLEQPADEQQQEQEAAAAPSAPATSSAEENGDAESAATDPKSPVEMEVEEDEEPFLRPPPTKKVKRGPHHPNKTKRISICIRSTAQGAASSSANAEASTVGEEARRHERSFISPQRRPTLSDEDALLELAGEGVDLDDDAELALAFFQETHEDQDPAYLQFQRQSQIAALQKKLQDIDREDRVSRQEIDDFIRSQLDDKQRSTSLSLEKYKVRADADQKRDLQRLQQLYEQKVQSNQARIQKGIQMLRERHGKELQALQQRLQQQGQGASFPQAQAQLTAKKQRQLAEFTAKGEEVKQKTEADYQAQMDKIRNNHVQRMAEIQNNRKKILEKLMVSFQQVRQRYLKRHLQRIMKRKEEILEAIQELSQPAGGGGSSIGGSNRGAPMRTSKPRTTSSTGAVDPTAAVFSAGLDGEDKAEFRQPSPVKSLWPWVRDAEHLSGAAARHKHRKAIMSQVTRQLSVELHNEGLWVSVHDGPMEDSSPSKAARPNGGVPEPTAPMHKEEEFLLWGTRAHAVLESIVCGEIPPGYDRFEFGDSLSSQGGQVRCVITDLRASNETASDQRAQAVVDYEVSQVTELEGKCKEFHRTVTESEAAVAKLQEKEKEGESALENATMAVEKAKRMKDEFTAKFRNYIGADGNVVQTPNPSDRQELQKALLNYNTNIDNVTRRENAARQVLGEIKTRIQKLQAILKTSQKNLSTVASALKKRKAMAESVTGVFHGRQPSHDKTAMSVADVIASLRKTAEKRRELMNEKKSGSVSNTWVQSLPDLPTSLKKSLWHKMHKRKQQIVLRPTPESIMNQLRSRITENFKAQQSRHTTLEDEMIKAEQLFLLASHPFSQEKLSTTPVTKSGENWAEPGWHLVLDVPESSASQSHILPCKDSFPFLERNITEIASAPGRQAASLLKLSHFRCLASPLSTVAIASSPAECGGIVPTKATPAGGDPFFLSEEVIAATYSFSISKPSSAKPSQARRKSGSSETADASASKNPPAHNTAVTADHASKSEVKAKAESLKEQQRKNEAKRRRSSKTRAEPPSNRQRKNPPTLADATSNKSTEAVPSSPRMSQRDQSRPSSDNQSTAAAVAAAAQAAAAAAAATAHYNQLMNKMPLQQPNAPHQNSTSQQQQNLQQFIPQGQVRPPQGSAAQPQFSNAQQRQLAQLRMMQHQAPSPHRPQLAPNFPQQPMSMQQFYNPLNHPGTPGRSSFPQQSPNLSNMHMQGRTSIQSPNSTPSHSHQGQQQQQHHHHQHQQAQQPQQQQHHSQHQQQPQKGNQGSSNDSQSDPLFML